MGAKITIIFKLFKKNVLLQPYFGQDLIFDLRIQLFE